MITVGTNYTIIWVLGAVTLNADGSLSGRSLRRTDRGSKGTEIWKRI